ncbi:MAG: hypothetical protein ACYTGC_02235 [Planctomycetota bacterium]|jgi:hypothetical protein
MMQYVKTGKHVAWAVAVTGVFTGSAMAGNSMIRVNAGVQGQGSPQIGTIEVDDNDGMGGGITATFTFDEDYAYLDEWYNFRWVNIQTGYTLDGMAQDEDPLLGTLPAVDPAPGPFPGGEDFNDPAPFYFTNDEHENCMAEGFGQICVPGESSTFSDNRSDPMGVNSQITFVTYLVAQSETDEDISGTTICVLAAFEWTYDNTTGAQTQTQSIPNPTADSINTALGNANAPGFDMAWEATTDCTLDECPSVLDCIFGTDGLTFFSPATWTSDGETIGETFPDGALPLPGETLYDFTYLPEEPNDWHWGAASATSTIDVVMVNFGAEDELLVEFISSPLFPDVELFVDVGLDFYQLSEVGGKLSDCCVPHETPGCEDPKCQMLVCELEPLCCGGEWNELCAMLAQDLCGPLCQGPLLWQGQWSQYPGDIPPSLGFVPTGPFRQRTDVPCPGDTNGDGLVNVNDQLNVIFDWGTDGSANNGDIDGNGIVNVNDLLIVILNWGPCGPPA